MTPSLIQVRDQLGRALVSAPDSALLHKANRLLSAVLARRAELSPALKLASARAVALALDWTRARSLSSGETMAYYSDAFDPRAPANAWWQRAVVSGLVDEQGRPVPEQDPLLALANMLDRAMQALRTDPDQAALDIANTLDRAYQAVAESASNVGQKIKSSLAMPALLTIAGFAAFGYARRSGRGA